MRLIDWILNKFLDYLLQNTHVTFFLHVDDGSTDNTSPSSLMELMSKFQ